ncbi:MAG: tetratricopeptide repeat protein [Candidatus Binatia bacterium]
MIRIWLGIALLWATSGAAAQCRPEGRGTFTAGLEALARGDMAAAGAAFTKLVESQPDCAEARNNLAVVEVEQGRLREAAEELRRATQLRPEYARAKMNLQRVEALLAERIETPAPPVQPTSTLERAEMPVPAVQPTSMPERAATEKTATPASEKGAATKAVSAATPQLKLKAEGMAVAFGIAALEPQGATACTVDTVARRVCVYTRTAEAIVAGECYPITAERVRAWPRWLMVAANERERIRLVDETGQRRLKIAPGRVAAPGDVVWLSQEDFASLRKKVASWRTSWIVVSTAKKDAAADEGTAAAVKEALQGWRSAWEQKALDDYVGYYSDSFAGPDRTHWRERKRNLFEQSGNITVQFEGPSIFVIDGTTVITTFEQRYGSQTTASHEAKAVRWQREGERWKITAETVLTEIPAGSHPPGG